MTGRRARRAVAAGALLLATGVLVAMAASAAKPPPVLRVCADPNNLPFSNDRLEGFENRLAELVAADLGASVEYTWWAQRRGFARNTLRAGECDVMTGVPSSYELARPTRPYYRSSYVFVWRTDRRLDIQSFDDPALRELRVGVHIIGDDYANAPPAHALSSRGMIANVVGYSIYGNYAEPNPPARLVEAVAGGAIDLAIVWGPIAGYFGRRQAVPLTIVPVSPEVDLPFLPFVFDISMGVRREEAAFQQRLDGILAARAAEIDAILDDYGVPYVKRVRRQETGR